MRYVAYHEYLNK